MARRSSSSSKPAARAPAPARRAAPPPAPAPAPAAHPPAMSQAPQQSGGMLAGLGATMAQGFAFGAGSSIARNVVNSVMGGGDSSAAPAPAAPAAPEQYAPPAMPTSQFSGVCGSDQKSFMDCLQQNAGNASACDFYFQALQACQNRN